MSVRTALWLQELSLSTRQGSLRKHVDGCFRVRLALHTHQDDHAECLLSAPEGIWPLGLAVATVKARAGDLQMAAEAPLPPPSLTLQWSHLLACWRSPGI